MLCSTEEKQNRGKAKQKENTVARATMATDVHDEDADG
jgi:hypothetical protein